MLSPARIARLSGLYTLAGAFKMMLQMVFSVIAARVLGIESYGILALGMTVFMLTERIGLFGMDVYTQKYMSGMVTDDMRNRFRAMVSLNVIIAFLLSTILLAAANPIAMGFFKQPRLVPVLRILAISSLFLIPYNLALAVFRARHLALVWSTLMTLRLIIKIAALLLLLLIPDKLLAVAWGSPLACSLSFLISLLVLSRIGFGFTFGGNLSGIGIVIRGSAVMLGIRLGYVLMQNAGKLVLGGYAAPADIGIYSLAASLAILPAIFHGGTVAALMPDIAATYREHGCNQTLKNNYHFANALTMLVGAVSFVLMVTFGGYALALLYKLKDPAYAVFCILAARTMFVFFAGATGTFLIMTGHDRIELLNTAATVILTIVLSVIGVRTDGIRGVAFAGLAATFLINAVQIVEIRMLTGFMALTRLHLWMFLLTASMAAVHFTFIQQLGFAAHLLSAVALIVITVAVFWLGLDNNTRSHLASRIRKNLPGGKEATA